VYWNRRVAASYAVKFFNTCSEDRENSAVTNHAILNGREGDTIICSLSPGQGDSQVQILNMPSRCAHAAANVSLGLWRAYFVLSVESKSHYSLSNPGFQPSLYRDPPVRVHRSADNPQPTSYGRTCKPFLTTRPSLSIRPRLILVDEIGFLS